MVCCGLTGDAKTICIGSENSPLAFMRICCKDSPLSVASFFVFFAAFTLVAPAGSFLIFGDNPFFFGVRTGDTDSVWAGTVETIMVSMLGKDEFASEERNANRSSDGPTKMSMKMYSSLVDVVFR